MKTIKEAAKEYTRMTYEEVYEPGDLSEQKLQCLNDFKKGVEFAQRWIPVEEELPTYLTHVLLKSANGKVQIGCFMDGMFNIEYHNPNKVTHWRPIELN